MYDFLIAPFAEFEFQSLLEEFTPNAAEVEENDTYVKADVFLKEAIRVVGDGIDLAREREFWVANRPPLTGASGG